MIRSIRKICFPASAGPDGSESPTPPICLRRTMTAAVIPMSCLKDWKSQGMKAMRNISINTMCCIWILPVFSQIPHWKICQHTYRKKLPRICGGHSLIWFRRIQSRSVLRGLSAKRIGNLLPSLMNGTHRYGTPTVLQRHRRIIWIFCGRSLRARSQKRFLLQLIWRGSFLSRKMARSPRSLNSSNIPLWSRKALHPIQDSQREMWRRSVSKTRYPLKKCVNGIMATVSAVKMTSRLQYIIRILLWKLHIGGNLSPTGSRARQCTVRLNTSTWTLTDWGRQLKSWPLDLKYRSGQGNSKMIWYPLNLRMMY